MSSKVFASLVAQSENLGDLIIRKNALDAAFSGRPVVALATGMPKSYLDAFCLPAGSACIQSPFRFQVLLLKEAVLRNADLLIAPGPVVLEGSVRRLAKAVVVLADSLIVRLLGGAVMSIGRSYRGTNTAARLLERAQIRLSTTYFVRDFESVTVLGAAVDVKPDMAFSKNQTDEQTERNQIAVSVRDVTPDTISLLRNLRDYAQCNALEIVLVTQVKRDEPGHRWLAAELHLKHVEWGGRSHAEQLREIYAVYSHSIAVVSNRLHALIVGLQNGAAAITLNGNEHPKLSSTLECRVPLLELDALLSDATPMKPLLERQRQESAVAWQQAQRELKSAISSDRGMSRL